MIKNISRDELVNVNDFKRNLLQFSIKNYIENKYYQDIS